MYLSSKNITKWFLLFVQIGPRILFIELPEVVVIALSDVVYQHLPPPLTIPLKQAVTFPIICPPGRGRVGGAG